MNIISRIFCLLFCQIWVVLNCSSSPKESTQNIVAEPAPPAKPPLFLLNEKDTVFIEKCSCSVRKLPVESGAGALGNAFLSNLTPESDREYELSCKGKVTNKTGYKLQNVTFQWEYLSQTKFPISKGPAREYKNNYILPKSSASITIVIGSDTGIRNYFTKEVKYYECKILSAVEVETGEKLIFK
ncbi:hypothetical protein [Leptospira levettii]|uniref:hypothetical protein n=1 Tax=Leptospira levettii TaxID=2023178 RepID=UPI003C6D976E